MAHDTRRTRELREQTFALGLAWKNISAERAKEFASMMMIAVGLLDAEVPEADACARLALMRHTALERRRNPKMTDPSRPWLTDGNVIDLYEYLKASLKKDTNHGR